MKKTFHGWQSFFILTSACSKHPPSLGPTLESIFWGIVQKQSACVFLFSCALRAWPSSSSMHVLLTSGLSLEFLRSWMQWSSRWNLGRVLQYLSRKFNDLPARDMYIERNIDPTISLWSCSSSVKNISACASMPTHESAAQRQVHISFRATCMPGFALTGGFCEVSCASQLSTTYVSNPLHFSSAMSDSVWWALTGWGSNHVTWQTSSASKMHGTATSQCWPQESTVPSPKLSTRIRASHAHIPSERHEEDRPPASWC